MQMTPDRLASLLRAATTGHRDRTPACPDEHQIAAYVDGTLAPEVGKQLELHLADCDACLVLVGLLSRERDPSAMEPVPDLTVARARHLASSQARQLKRHAPYWAAAAAVLVSISVLVRVSQFPGPGVESQMAPDARAVRKGATATPALQVLYPRPGTAVAAGRVAFRWTAVPGSRYYEVRVVTDSGDVVVEERVAGTEWRPTAQLPLRPGAEYFVHVDAFIAEGKAVSSDHIPFRVSE